MTKTCPNCMCPVPITAKVCPHCRGDVSDPVDTLGADAVRGVTDLFNSGSSNQRSAHQGSGKPLRGVALLVFLLGAIVIFTFFLSFVGADQGWWKGNLLNWIGLAP